MFSSRLRWLSVAALGKPVVPEVYWMLIGVGRSQCWRPMLVDSRLRYALAAAAHFVPPDHARRRRAAHRRRPSAAAEMPRRCNWPGSAVGQLRANLGQHREIVGLLEPSIRNKATASHLLQHVFQLERPIGRIDRHQHGADSRGGELQHHPLGHVRRPDGHMLAAANPERQQAREPRRRPVRQTVATRAACSIAERRAHRRR